MDPCRDGMPRIEAKVVEDPRRIEAKVVEDPHASPSAADVMHMASRSSYRIHCYSRGNQSWRVGRVSSASAKLGTQQVRLKICNAN